METVIVGERGQFTIPKDIRMQLGISPKSPVAIEVKDGGLFIRPVFTIPLRTFSDEEIAKMVAEDTMEPGERKRILSKWRR